MSDAELKVDEYLLVSCIASGGQSQIWEVSTPGNNEALAMKLLLPEAFADPEEGAVLKHEAKVGKAFEHPNILPVHKFVKTKEHAYLILPLFRAANLKNFIGIDPLGVQVRFRKLFESTCLALDHMHSKGWIHHDIKPDNILLNKASEVRLIDFSLSTRVTSSIGKVFAGKVKTIKGTRTYIAPETIRKQRPSPQTDMYSLGITMFEALTERPPFMGMHPQELLKKHIATRPPAPSEFNPNVTPEMDLLIAKMLKKKPKDRPASMQAIASEFRNIKVFHEPVQETGKVSEEDQLTNEVSLTSRLDSRTDHLRSEAVRKNPDLAATLQPQIPRNRPVLNVQIVDEQAPAAQPKRAAVVPPTKMPRVAGQPGAPTAPPPAGASAPPPPGAPPAQPPGAPPAQPPMTAPPAQPPMAAPPSPMAPPAHQQPVAAPVPQPPPVVTHGQGVPAGQPLVGQPIPAAAPPAQVPPTLAPPAAAPPTVSPPIPAPPPVQVPPTAAPPAAPTPAPPPTAPEPDSPPGGNNMDWMEDLPDVL